eukprot:3348403-Prymnesium_polylepis.1
MAARRRRLGRVGRVLGSHPVQAHAAHAGTHTVHAHARQPGTGVRDVAAASRADCCTARETSDAGGTVSEVATGPSMKLLWIQSPWIEATWHPTSSCSAGQSLSDQQPPTP